MSDHLKFQIRAEFGEKSLYEIFNVSKSAEVSEINRAYRKLALQHHPDRGGNAETFKALSAAHSILTDSLKRKAYDEDGDFDAEAGSDDFEFWYQYFRNLFPKISVQDINTFSEKYKGSNEEKQDIYQAYDMYHGDLNKIKEVVLLIEDDDEPRLISVIDEGIRNGTIQDNRKYQSCKSKSERKSSKKRSRSSSNQAQQCSVDEELVEALQQRHNSRGDGGMASLIARLQHEHEEKPSGSSSSSAKKNKKTKGVKMSTEEIPDEEFERLQKEMMARRKR